MNLVASNNPRLSFFTAVQVVFDKLPVYENLPPCSLSLPAESSSSGWSTCIPADVDRGPFSPGFIPPHLPSQRSQSLPDWCSEYLSLSPLLSAGGKSSTSRDPGWYHWSYFKLSWLLGCMGEISLIIWHNHRNWCQREKAPETTEKSDSHRSWHPQEQGWVSWSWSLVV